jgi:hypothetical protein
METPDGELDNEHQHRSPCCFSYLRRELRVFRLASQTCAETDYTTITECPEMTIY